MIVGYQRRTVDVEQLFTLILREALTEFASTYGIGEMQVLGQQDFDAIQHVPFVVVRAGNAQMVGPNAWESDVFAQIVANGRDDASDIADMVYVAMHESHDKNTRVPFVGGVTSVEDIDMPSRTSTTLLPTGNLEITQYDGSWRVSVRKI